MERQSSLAYWFVVITGHFLKKLHSVCSTATRYGWVQALRRFLLVQTLSGNCAAALTKNIPLLLSADEAERDEINHA
jgi:hypothetical protein